jgi:hypothetical protein
MLSLNICVPWRFSVAQNQFLSSGEVPDLLALTGDGRHFGPWGDT